MGCCMVPAVSSPLPPDGPGERSVAPQGVRARTRRTLQIAFVKLPSQLKNHLIFIPTKWNAVTYFSFDLCFLMSTVFPPGFFFSISIWSECNFVPFSCFVRCLETLIIGQLSKIRSTINNIRVIDSASVSAHKRLSMLNLNDEVSLKSSLFVAFISWWFVFVWRGLRDVTCVTRLVWLFVLTLYDF